MAIIPRETVAETTANQTPPQSLEGVAFAFEVSQDRSWATIWAAWQDTQGAHIRPYRSEPGTHWLTEEIKRLRDQYRVQTIGCDDAGPARTTMTELALAGYKITALSARDFANATGDIIQAFNTHALDHNGDEGLTRAIDGAALRRMGENEALSRRNSTGPIWELIAATVAYRLATLTATAPAPLIIGLED